MTGTHFVRLSIAMAMPILSVATGFGCEGARTALLVGRDAAVFMGAGGGVGPAATGAGGSVGPAATGTGGGGGPAATGTGGSVGPAATGTGGATSRGGATGAGGVIVAGSKTSAGGAAGGASGASTTPVSMGGNSTMISGRDAGAATGGSSGTGGTTMASAPVISDSGYVKVSAGTVVMMGFIVSSTAGSGSSISLTYGTSDFCASGTVAANSTYKSWANAGFTVNQDPSGASGSSSTLVLSGSTISIGYVNKGGSPLEFQLYDGSNYWCYNLPPSSAPTTTTIPFASLNTQCWDGRGTPFTSGTAIRSVNLVVPGRNTTATPFDFCFLGLTVN